MNPIRVEIMEQRRRNAVVENESPTFSFEVTMDFMLHKILRGLRQPETLSRVIWQYLRPLMGAVQQMNEPQIINRRLSINAADFMSHLGQIYGGRVRQLWNPEYLMAKWLISERRRRQLTKPLAIQLPLKRIKRLHNRAKKLSILPAKKARAKRESVKLVPKASSLMELPRKHMQLPPDLPRTLFVADFPRCLQQIKRRRCNRLRRPSNLIFDDWMIAERRRNSLFKPYARTCKKNSLLRVSDMELTANTLKNLSLVNPDDAKIDTNSIMIWEEPKKSEKPIPNACPNIECEVIELPFIPKAPPLPPTLLTKFKPIKPALLGCSLRDLIFIEMLRRRDRKLLITTNKTLANAGEVAANSSGREGVENKEVLAPLALAPIIDPDNEKENMSIAANKDAQTPLMPASIRCMKDAMDVDSMSVPIVVPDTYDTYTCSYSYSCTIVTLRPDGINDDEMEVPEEAIKFIGRSTAAPFLDPKTTEQNLDGDVNNDVPASVLPASIVEIRPSSMSIPEMNSSPLVPAPNVVSETAEHNMDVDVNNDVPAPVLPASMVEIANDAALVAAPLIDPEIKSSPSTPVVLAPVLPAPIVETPSVAAPIIVSETAQKNLDGNVNNDVLATVLPAPIVETPSVAAPFLDPKTTEQNLDVDVNNDVPAPVLPASMVEIANDTALVAPPLIAPEINSSPSTPDSFVVPASVLPAPIVNTPSVAAPETAQQNLDGNVKNDLPAPVLPAPIVETPPVAVPIIVPIEVENRPMPTHDFGRVLPNVWSHEPYFYYYR